MFINTLLVQKVDIMGHQDWNLFSSGVNCKVK